MADTPVRDSLGRRITPLRRAAIERWLAGGRTPKAMAATKVDSALRSVQASIGLRPDLVPDFGASIHGHIFFVWRKR